MNGWAMQPDTAVEAQPRYASTGAGYYPIIVGFFCGLLLISNVVATKLIAFGPIIADGGVFLFPLVYIVGDILSEVYGLRAAKRAIYVGFVLAIVASLVFWLAVIAPPAPGYENEAAFAAVLGFVPRVVAASLAGYLVGQLLNALVVVRIKDRTREKALWLRLVGSTVVGEFADTAVFCTIAFYGVITGGEFLNYLVFGYVYKCTIEIMCLPITYRVIAFVKRREPTYGLASEVA